MNILGISAFYHDSAAALVSDGEIVAAAQEERFTRKNTTRLSRERACAIALKKRASSAIDIDFVAFYDKPFLKFERLLETYLAFAPQASARSAWRCRSGSSEKLFQKDLLLRELSAFDPGRRLATSKLLFTEHHESHAAWRSIPRRSRRPRS